MSETISVPTWFKTPRGGWLRRDALEPENPASTYSYVKNELGLRPEDYGISATKPYGLTDDEWAEEQEDKRARDRG